ncbi:MAG: tetratricopeptide repeat protein [Pseudonocardiaceae bacterium]|nr:tetratricopeptide repeat protein [Pseudonocardiaceae bacterium]
MASTRLCAVREALGWSQAAVAERLNRVGQQAGLPARPVASRVAELSRWENGRVTPDRDNQRLLRRVYGLTSEELGFPRDVHGDVIDAELRDRVAVSRHVDAQTVALFRQQTDNARATDRRFGATALLEQLRGEIRQLEDLLHHAVLADQRAPLAVALSEASTLAGWTALDVGSTDHAWQHYETAKTAARESDSPVLLAHAAAEQAFLLLDLDEADSAVELLGEVRAHAEPTTPELQRAWLAAAAGEAFAAAGRHDHALRAFDQADALTPEDRQHPELPFVFLGGDALARWRGNALVRLGDPGAIDHFTRLVHHTPLSARAHAGMLVDLAYAHAATGDRAAALTYAGHARRLASQIGSRRQQRRLQRLQLPLTGLERDAR